MFLLIPCGKEREFWFIFVEKKKKNLFLFSCSFTEQKNSVKVIFFFDKKQLNWKENFVQIEFFQSIDFHYFQLHISSVHVRNMYGDRDTRYNIDKKNNRKRVFQIFFTIHFNSITRLEECRPASVLFDDGQVLSNNFFSAANLSIYLSRLLLEIHLWNWYKHSSIVFSHLF